MRKLLIVALVLVGAVVWATGSEEVEENPKVTIGLWGTDRPLYPGNPDSVLFYEDYLFGDKPYEVEFIWYAPGESGAAQPIDLDIAAGTEPDIYGDYMGRVSKYANARYAEDIAPLVGEEVLSRYIPSFLDLMNKDGVQYGLPTVAWTSNMIVNVTLLEKVGMAEVIEDGTWTIDEFTEASRKVGALGDGYFGYVFFAATTGGDYWHLGFLPGFGANLYQDGRIAINSPEGIAALRWYRDFHDAGLAMPGAAALGYADMLGAWPTGKILAYAQGPSAAGPATGAAAFEAGTAEEPFNSVLVSFPSVDGDYVPLAMGPDGVMIFKGHVNDNVIDAFLTLTGERAQRFLASVDVKFPSLQELTFARQSDPAWVAGFEHLQNCGVWDMGIGLAEYGAVRLLVPPMFQAIYTGELTVEEAVARFEEEANEILD